MQTLEVPVRGGTLGGWRSGSGAPAIVLHGGPGLGDWHEDLAAELDGIYECVRFNQRGLPPGDAPGPYTVDGFVADVLAVLDAVGWERATMIGHSWGGLLAQHVAASHPERVDALVGLSSLGGIGPDGGWGDMDAELGRRLPAETARRVEELDRKLYRGGGSDEDTLVMLRLCWPYYFADPAAAPPMPESSVNSEVYAQVHASVLDHFGRGHPEEGLRRFAKPACFLHGSADPIPAHHVQATADVMPAGRFICIDECGHLPWMEKPNAVRSAIEELLA